MKNLTVSQLFKTITKLGVLSTALLLSACSTNYTPESDQSSQYDFSSIKTYSVIGDEQYKNPMFSDIDRVRFDSAIDDSMQQRGKFKVSESEADVLVSYFVVTKDKIKINSTYSGGYYGHGYGHSGYGGSISNISTRNYVEGTLVLDVIDNKTKQSVYRSTLVKPIKSYDSIEERKQAINTVVNKMFKALPIS